MKRWKKKYVALLLTAALCASVTAFAACDESALGGNSGNGGSGGKPSQGTSASVGDSSLDDDDGNSSVGTSASDDGGGQQKPDENVKTVTETEWKRAFTMTNYALTITRKRLGSVDEEYNYFTDRDGNKYAVDYGNGKGVETYVETLGDYESYNRYDKDEQTGEWEKIFVSGEHNYSEMYFALNVYNQAFGERFNDFTYDTEKEVYYVEGVAVEEIAGDEMAFFDKVEIAFQGANLKAVIFTWQAESVSHEMINTFSKWGEISITLPEVKEVKTVTETEWENTLTATNYTALGESWSGSSSSSPLHIKREENKYYMLAGSEEYIVETKGDTSVYYRWSDDTKSWEEDNSQPSTQHLIAEQMRSVLVGQFDTFTYNEESECYEATSVALSMMGQTKTFDSVTVSFENGNLSVLYLETGKSGMRFTYSQYEATVVEFIDKETNEDSNSSDKNSASIGVSTEDPNAGNNGDDHQAPKMTLEEWTNALSTTNYEVSVKSSYADGGYRLSRADNLYYLELEGVKSASGRFENEYYFEVTDTCVYIYYYDADAKAWSKEEYTDEWKDKVGLYYGIDMLLEELVGKYDEFDVEMRMAHARDITIAETAVESIDIEIRNGVLSCIRIDIQDLGNVDMSFWDSVSITLPV